MLDRERADRSPGKMSHHGVRPKLQGDVSTKGSDISTCTAADSKLETVAVEVGQFDLLDVHFPAWDFKRLALACEFVRTFSIDPNGGEFRRGLFDMAGVFGKYSLDTLTGQSSCPDERNKLGLGIGGFTGYPELKSTYVFFRQRMDSVR